MKKIGLLNSYPIKRILTTMCKVEEPQCPKVLYNFLGFNSKGSNAVFPKIITYMSQRTGIKQLGRISKKIILVILIFRFLVHFNQNFKNGRFQMFDYDERKNLEVYGLKSPPDYDLEKVSVSEIVLYHGSNDSLIPLKVNFFELIYYPFSRISTI